MRAPPPSQDRAQSGPPNLSPDDSRRWLLSGCWQPELISTAQTHTEIRPKGQYSDPPLLLRNHHGWMCVDWGLVNVENHISVCDRHGLATNCSRAVTTHRIRP